jgi:N-acetylglucosamine-6-phosphate deacetylase
VAPELAQATGFIQYLRQQGVIVSLGHSDATFQEAQAGIAAGASYATHLFNAMRPIHHREPGIATAILLDERVTAELVLDGFHLHPSMVQLALKMKGKSRLVLVSDAMRAKCLGDGEFSLGGQPVVVKDGMACLPNGTIAGSVLKLNQALRHFINYTHSSMEEAIMLTSTNPARMLGLAHRKGSIAIGKDADLVVLNEHFEVVATFCQGVKVSAGERL